MISLIVLSGLLAVGLAAVHLFSIKLRLLDVTPRSIWLSIAGGYATVTRCFMLASGALTNSLRKVLPKLNRQQK